MDVKVRFTEAVEELPSVQERQWQKEKARLNRKLRFVVSWVVGCTVGAFLLMLVAGVFAAAATPTGWAAWRVGLLSGGITAMIICVIGIAAAFAYLADN